MYTVFLPAFCSAQRPVSLSFCLSLSCLSFLSFFFLSFICHFPFILSSFSFIVLYFHLYLNVSSVTFSFLFTFKYRLPFVSAFWVLPFLYFYILFMLFYCVSSSFLSCPHSFLPLFSLCPASVACGSSFDHFCHYLACKKKKVCACSCVS